MKTALFILIVGSIDSSIDYMIALGLSHAPSDSFAHLSAPLSAMSSNTTPVKSKQPPRTWVCTKYSRQRNDGPWVHEESGAISVRILEIGTTQLRVQTPAQSAYSGTLATSGGAFETINLDPKSLKKLEFKGLIKEGVAGFRYTNEVGTIASKPSSANLLLIRAFSSSLPTEPRALQVPTSVQDGCGRVVVPKGNGKVLFSERSLFEAYTCSQSHQGAR